MPQSKDNIEKRCLEILNIQSLGLLQRYKKSFSKSMVVGLSGGLDSTLALLVIVHSLKLLNEPIFKCFAITMPGFGTTKKTKGNVEILCDSLGIRLNTIPINEMSELHLKQLKHNIDNHDVTYENVQARIRTLILMNKANQTSGIVVGTGDMSELALGWATYNGDHMSMYNVNAGIPKTLIRYIIGAAHKLDTFKNSKKVLEDIMNTPVSPELLPPKEGEIVQKTEDILGPYEVHDFCLYYFLRFGFSKEKIFWLLKKAFIDERDENDLEKWCDLFFKRFFTQQFKRSCMPDAPKIGSVSLSPRADWRMPSDTGIIL